MPCTMFLAPLLPLVLLASRALCASLPGALPASVRDMSEDQIPGVYKHLPLSAGKSSCPPSLTVSQVEPMGTAREQMFIIPHEFISVPNYPRGRLACLDARAPAGSVVNFSSTILRRSADLPLDRSFDIIDRFALAGEAFFLGYELGRRICNGYVLPAATGSLWAAPSEGRVITARTNRHIITFRTGFKYIYFFSNPPCLYRGDGRKRGRVQTVPSPSPTPSVSPRPSAPPVIAAPPAGGAGTVGDGGGGSGGGGPRPSARPGSLDTSLPQANNGAAPICFPGGARVRVLRDGVSTATRIEDVRAGDVVHDGFADGRPTFSAVLGLSHHDAGARETFVRLAAANHSLVLSAAHYVETGRGTVPARRVVVGDVLLAGRFGRAAPVVAVGRTRRRGLFAPVTKSGTIVVDDVLASAYTEALHPPAAHAALAPLRALGAAPAAPVVAWASSAFRWGARQARW